MTATPQANSEEVGRFYDQFTDLTTEIWGGNLHVGYWLDKDDDATFETAAEQLTDQLIQRLVPRPGDRVLDVGCGVGQPALSLARARGDVDVVGISVSQHQIARATTRAAEAGMADRVTFELADAMALPFPDASFDGAWALESLLHMPDKGKVLREIARVLRPGSRVVIADLFNQPQTDLSYRDLITTIGLADYQELVEQAGMSALEITDITAHTLIPESSRAMLKARLQERQDDVVRVIGEEEFSRAMDDMFAPPGYGYALVTALRG